MICRLCLKNVENVIEIYGEDGIQHNIAQVVQTYFDLELKPEDSTSKFICKECWLMVSQFHKFYLAIKEAQRQLKDVAFDHVFTPEIVIIKSEPCENVEDYAEDIFQEDTHIIGNDNADDETDSEILKEEPRRSKRMRQINKLTYSSGKQRKPKIKKTTENKSIEKKTKKKEPTVRQEEEKEDEDDDVKQSLPKGNERDEKIAAFMELICEICQEKEPTFGKLCAHIKKIHKTKGYVRCCNKKIFERIALLEHIEMHSNPDYLKCKICDKTLSDRRCYDQHMLLKHAAEEEKTYCCDKCPRRFAKYNLLVRHKVSHAERKHKCEVCHNGFPTKSQLNTHRKVKHMNYGIMCDICAKVLLGPTAFDLHQKEHQGVPIPKVQCTLCGSWQKNKQNLQKHMRRHNEDGKKHICNICGKQAPNHNALMGHQRYVHEAKRSHECNICKKSFKKPLALKEHMSLHTGEVLYNCPHCSRTFISGANMYAHRKKAHPIEFEETRRKRLEEAAKPTIGTNKLPTVLEISKPT